MKNIRSIVGVFAVLTAALATQPLRAAGAESAFTGGQVTVASAKPFEQVSEAIQSLVAKNGMMVMAEVNQGKMLSMTGLRLKATLFLVGNPTVGKQTVRAEPRGRAVRATARLRVQRRARQHTRVLRQAFHPAHPVPRRQALDDRTNARPETRSAGHHGRAITDVAARGRGERPLNGRDDL